MKVTPTRIPDVLLLEPRLFADDRGFLFESFNQRVFEEATGIRRVFVQDNHSRSDNGVLRGLHYQVRQAQGKLVRVIAGGVFDVVVDLRRPSATFREWAAFVLSAENKRQLWVFEGFAHGFVVTSDRAEMIYKATDYYAPEHERTLLWNDPDLGITWPVAGEPVLSPKDAAGIRLEVADVFS
jgi:dTDP-4-dehydrorhamnose 3,5-epimerase